MTAALIVQRRNQVLIHSYLYYELDRPIVSDHTWHRWAAELVDLQRAHPGPVGFYDPQFEDWSGETGFHLPRDGRVHDRAVHLLKLHDNPALRGHQAPPPPAQFDLFG